MPWHQSQRMKTFHGNMGHQEWLLVTWLCRGWRVEFCMSCQTNFGGPQLTSNGMDRVTILFLCCIWDRARCCWTLCWDTSGTRSCQQTPPIFTNKQCLPCLAGFWCLRSQPFWYLLKVYIDDYIGLAIPTSKQILDHVEYGVICGMHDVLPSDSKETDWSHRAKIIVDQWWCMGNFEGASGVCCWMAHITLCCYHRESKLHFLLQSQLGCGPCKKHFVSPFWLWHSVPSYTKSTVFISITAGKGLVSPFYTIMREDHLLSFSNVMQGYNKSYRTASSTLPPVKV